MSRPIGTDEMLDRIEELEAKLAKVENCFTVELRHMIMLWFVRPKDSVAWEVRNAVRGLLKELDGQDDEC